MCLNSQEDKMIVLLFMADLNFGFFVSTVDLN